MRKTARPVDHHAEAVERPDKSRPERARRRGGCRPLPPRIAERPSPADWHDDELLTLEEAAALMWPDGPLTSTSLRHAVREKILDVAEIAGKILTCRAALRRMSACKPRRSPKEAACHERAPDPPTPLGGTPKHVSDPDLEAIRCLAQRRNPPKGRAIR